MKRIVCLILLLSLALVHGAGLTDWFMKPPLGVTINWSHPLARGLVGFWLMNEGGGSKVFDLSGNGNIGTFYGDTKWVPGKFGSCLSFDGNGDYVDLGNNPIFNFRQNSYTFSVWMKPYPTGELTGRLINKRTGTGNWTMIDSADGGSPFVRFTTGGSTNYLSTEYNYGTFGVWYHVVAMRNSSGCKFLYVNGILRYSGECETPILDINNTASILIGSWSNNYHNGTIDDVMIFNRALTAQEIQQLYREPFGMFRPSFDLKMYWGIPVVGGAPPQIF